jgi:hypothetical protein
LLPHRAYLVFLVWRQCSLQALQSLLPLLHMPQHQSRRRLRFKHTLLHPLESSSKLAQFWCTVIMTFPSKRRGQRTQSTRRLYRIYRQMVCLLKLLVKNDKEQRISCRQLF